MGVVTVYKPIQSKQDAKHTQHYYRHSTDSNSAIGSPCNVCQLSLRTVQCQETGLQLMLQRETGGTFWEHLQSLGGKWIWEYMQEGETDILWLNDTLTTGILVGVMDGSYDRHKAKSCSGEGWVLACRSSKKTLRVMEEEVPTSSASWSGTLTSLLNTPLRSRLRLP
jgi:hypothetical protein